MHMTAHSGNHHGAHGQHPSDGEVMRFASLKTFAIGAALLIDIVFDQPYHRQLNFRVNANLVDNELIAGFEWNIHQRQIDLTW